MRYSLLLCGLCAVLAVDAALIANAMHGSWQDHYTDASQTPCCGPRDCQQIEGRLVTRESDRVQVEVQGVPLWLPQGSVHASEDGAFWLCRKGPPEVKEPLTSAQVRCVFYAVGS